MRIRALLGRGGMAEVWDAEDALGVRFALKRVLPEHAGDPRFARMFADEVTVSRAIADPHVLRVLDHGVDEAGPWLGLELVDGHDAATWIAPPLAALPELPALYVAREVALGLHAAHEANGADGRALGLVHRDVSPGNVLIARDGRVVLGDFGVARADGRVERTSAGVAKGKMAYMAPEQLLGATLDRRTDVLALGCTLHALLTGRSPLADERAMAALLSGAEVALDPRLAADVRSVVGRALASSRARRWPTALAMAEALDGLLDARGGDARAALVEALAMRAVASVAHGGERDADAASVHDGDASERLTVRHTPSGARATMRRRVAIVGLSLLTVALVLGGGVALRRESARWSERAPLGKTATRDEAAPRVEPVRSAEPGRRDDATRGGAASARALGSDPLALVASHSGAANDASRDPSVAVATIAGASDDAHDAPQRRVRAPSTSPPDGTAPDGLDDAQRAAANAPSETSTGARPTLAATGFLVVAGPGAVRASILVDGARVDFAPATIELPVGAHRVELRSADGTVIGVRSVEVSAAQTRRSPLRWLVSE